MTVTVREAGPADAETLSEIGGVTYRASFADGMTEAQVADVLARKFSPEAYRAALAGNVLLLVEVDGVPAGLCQIGPVRIAVKGPQPGPRDRSVDTLYVLPDFQRRGLGRHLMTAALAHPSLQDAPALWLDVWEENDRAVALYESLGFERVGTTEFIADGVVVGEDLVMRRERQLSLP
ncbi:MAG: GNAT family N-acetyltransferase [Alphaproteobacteria bacterium]|nr:GNAT family N-acetyltransferase [Alphaproteobacteria bacterium]